VARGQRRLELVAFLINVPVGVFMAGAIAAILHEPASAAGSAGNGFGDQAGST